MNTGNKKHQITKIYTEQDIIQDDKQKEYKYQKHKNKKTEKNELLQKRQELAKQIIYSKENEAHKNLPTVSIVLLGHQKMHLKEKPGFCEYIIIYEQSGKFLKKKSDMMLNTSPNRAIILGLIDGLRQLKTPYHVKIYTKTPIGLKKMINGGNSPNADVLNELREYLSANGHAVENIVDIETVENLFCKYK